MSPLAAGLWMLPSSAGFIAGSMLTPVLTRRVRPLVVMTSGLALAAAGFALLTQLGTDRSTGLALLVTGSVVFSVAHAPVDTLATSLALAAAPPQRAGAVGPRSPRPAPRSVGPLGIAVLGVAGTAIYRSRIAAATTPARGPTARRPGRTRHPGRRGGRGRSATRPDRLRAGRGRYGEAFGYGLHTAFAICAVLTLAAATAAATTAPATSTLPNQRPS